MSPSSAPRQTGPIRSQGAGGPTLYPQQAEQIVLVMDNNLNTHTAASLYETFPPAEAKRLAEKLEISITHPNTVAG